MATYKELLKEEAKKDDFTFLSFLNKLDNEMLFNFIEDIILENTENIRPAFPPFKGAYTDDIAFKSIREMPYVTFQKIQGFLENIFSFAIDKRYVNNEKVIDTIIALTARRKQGLSVPYIISALENPLVRSEIKTNLAILLSKIENTVSFLFWDTKDYADHPYLIPAYISAYKNTEPIKGLEILNIVKQKPTDYSYYWKPICTSLENILIRKRNFTEYITLLDKLPEWAIVEFNSIISSAAFGKHRIKEEIEALRARKTEIKIGISLFPDLLLLNLAHKLGYFSTNPDYSFNIQIVHWNRIFDDLFEKDLDLIVANRKVCETMNGLKNHFKFVQPLIGYKGFSIIFQEDFDIPTYETIKMSIDDENEALKRTILSLTQKKIKIFASKNTDHYETLINLLKLVGLSADDVTIISNKDPHDGYELFKNKEVDAIVGGFPQKLQALKHGKEFISQNACNLPFTQVNGLIIKSAREAELEPAIDAVVYGWHKIIRELKRDTKLLRELVKLYNQTLIDMELVYNTLNEDLFIEYWSNTYNIPERDDDIRKLPSEKQMEESQKELIKLLAKIESE